MASFPTPAPAGANGARDDDVDRAPTNVPVPVPVINDNISNYKYNMSYSQGILNLGGAAGSDDGC